MRLLILLLALLPSSRAVGQHGPLDRRLTSVRSQTDQPRQDNLWSTNFGLAGGIRGEVAAIAPFGDGAVFAGRLWEAGGREVNNVAFWSGNSWEPMGSGVDGTVADLASNDGILYAGGRFKTAGGHESHLVAAWDGNEWKPLGRGLEPSLIQVPGKGPTEVNTLAVAGGNLYASWRDASHGYGAGLTCGLARWDGTSWQVLEKGLGCIERLAADDSVLYSSRWVVTEARSVVHSIARWSETGWSPIDSPPDFPRRPGEEGTIRQLVVRDSELVVAQNFIPANADLYSLIWSRRDGVWSRMGPHLNGLVHGLALYEDAIYIGGAGFTAYAREPHEVWYDEQYYAIATWNGNRWETVGSGIGGYGYVDALAVVGAELFTGGYFRDMGGRTAIGAARWDGHEWRTLDANSNGGLNAVPSVLLSDGAGAYVGGSFTLAGDKRVPNLARWTGAGWEAVGDGLESAPRSLALSDGELFATAYVDEADPSGVGLFRLSDGGWQLVPNNLAEGAISRLVSSGGPLFALGSFEWSDGRRGKVARIEGEYWHLLREDAGLFVRDAAALETRLLVAVAPEEPDGVSDTELLHWTGASWETLSPPHGISVSAVAMTDSVLLVAGEPYDGMSTTRVLHGDGEAWSALGGDLQGTIVDLIPTRRSIYIGVNRRAEDGRICGYVARWNGTDWSVFEGTVFGGIGTMTAEEGGVFIGGWFGEAGGRSSTYVAHLRIPEATASERPEANAGNCELEPVYPNPLVGPAVIGFEVSEPGPTKLEVFDLLGRRMALLVDGHLSAGRREIVWSPDAPAAGPLLIRLISGSCRQARVVVRS